MKTYIKKLQLGIVAAILVSSVVSANATILDAWRFNLSAAGAGGGDATNIDYIVVDGKSTVLQQLVGGSPVGQTFSDSGFLSFIQYHQESALLTDNFILPTGYTRLYLKFDNLTGIFNPGNTVTFNPDIGTIKLWLDSDSDVNPATGTSLELASYKIKAPSGGSAINFYGGAGGTATIDITLMLDTQIAPNLFQNSAGVNFDPLMVLHLVNVNSLIDPNFNPNPTFPAGGTGTSVLHVNNAGQYNATTVPEPGTLALTGLGLMGLLIGSRRRKLV